MERGFIPVPFRDRSDSNQFFVGRFRITLGTSLCRRCGLSLAGVAYVLPVLLESCRFLNLEQAFRYLVSLNGLIATRS